MSLELTYDNGLLVRRWELDDGFPVCPHNAILASDEDAKYWLAKGEVISELNDLVTEYETALQVKEPGSEIPQTIPELDENGEPTGNEIPNPDYQEVPHDIPAYDPETGEPNGTQVHPLWAKYEAAQSLIEDVDQVVKDLADWRAGDISKEAVIIPYVESEAQSKLATVQISAPLAVSPRQARLALQEAGLLEQVLQLIEQQPEQVQIEWEYATLVELNHPTVQLLADALQLDEDQLIALFARAAEF